MNFVNGAQPCNVFWKVGSSATLGSGSVFAGNILALESISLDDAVTVAGRLLARNGAVTLINDTVTRAPCATPGTSGDAGGVGDVGGGSPGTGGGGSGNRGRGGNRGGNGNVAGPTVQVNGVPRPRGGKPLAAGSRVRCIDQGFLAKFRIHSPVAMRRVEVFLDGELIERTSRKRFSVRIDVAGLRSGRNTIRVRAVDRRGRVDVASRSFRSCSAARPTPSFTG